MRLYGRVQGVNFRSSAKREASRLGLSGFAKNEPDGSVTVEVEGTRGAAAAFRMWAGTGPARADVIRVESFEVSPVGGKGFAVS